MKPLPIPLFLAALLLLVLVYGLGAVFNENIRVAPRTAEAMHDHLTPHMKNTTRFAGSADDVARSVHRAVFLDAGPGDARSPAADWRDAARGAIRTDPASRHVVVLPGDDDALAWALPGLFWAMHARAPVVFVRAGHIESFSADETPGADLPAFVLAPESLISDNALDSWRERGRRVQRVAGPNLAAHAVAVAEYRDPESGFGWGRTYDRRDGYFEYVVTTPAEARAGLAALPLAVSNATALLYAGDDGGIPGETDRYAWTQRADWFVTPAEGPFRHFFIVGDRVSYAAQARLDFALEKGPYASAGPDALGAMEGLAIVFIALGIAGGVFVWVHGQRLLPDLMPAMRIAWAFTAALVPVLGVMIYLAAYRRPKHPPGDEHAHTSYMRPPSIQSAAATAMGFGFGAPLMIVIGFGFVFFGFPLFFGRWADGWPFLFGAGMPLMMFGMWAGAILVAWLCAQAPMMKMMMPRMPARKRYAYTLGITVTSMTAVSLGMMTSAWILQMGKLPMMPKDDDILWFGAMWLASSVGFLVAWPLNYPMVRMGWKMGGA